MSFSKQVNQHLAKYERRIAAVYKQSAQTVAEQANATVNEGGRLRIDTGFLRASQAAQLNSMPSGPTRGEKGAAYTSRIGTSPTAALASWQPGDTLYIGWTANYARPREYRDGFVRGAAEKWSAIVDSAAARAKARL